MSPLRLVSESLVARRNRTDFLNQSAVTTNLGRALLLLAIFVAVPLCIGTAEAQEKRTRYCYKTCFYNLHEAEAELRASTAPYGAFWRKDETSPTTISTTTDYIIRYVLDDQPASVMYPAGFMIGGNGVQQGICSPIQSPYDNNSCADEDEGVNGMLAKLKGNSTDCVFTKDGYSGSHGEPYVHSREVNGHGQLTLSSIYAGGIRKKYKYSVWCPGVG